MTALEELQTMTFHKHPYLLNTSINTRHFPDAFCSLCCRSGWLPAETIKNAVGMLVKFTSVSSIIIA